MGVQTPLDSKQIFMFVTCYGNDRLVVCRYSY